MRQAPMQLTTGGGTAQLKGQSMASSFATDGQNLISIYAYSIQVVWSGGTAPSGTFKLQGSNDPGDNIPQLIQPTNWTDITSSPVLITGTPGSLLYDVVECSYRWVRLVYTAASGSATITDAIINVKGV